MRFNVTGALIGLIISTILWILLVKFMVYNKQMGEAAYFHALWVAGVGYAVGGLVTGVFVKENYENFHIETDEEKKKRLKKLN